MPTEAASLPSVESWLFSTGFEGAVREALERHRQRDVAAVRSAASASGQGPNVDSLRAVALLLGERPELLHRAPACGGIHLDRSDPELDQKAIAAGTSMLAAELAALNGTFFEGEVKRSGSVAFPIARCSVHFDGVNDVRLESKGGLVEASWVDGRAVIDPRVGSDTTRRLEGNGIYLDDETVVGVQVFNVWPTLASTMRGGLRVSAIDAGFSASTREAATRGLRILGKAHEALLDEIVGAGICLVPLATQSNERESFSVRQLPGVIYTNFVDPFDVIDLTCHEYLHLKLFLLQEDHELMLRPDAPVLSPWRPDLRSAEGLYHAAYVFFGAADLLDRLFRVWSASERGRARLLVWRAAIEASADLLPSAEPAMTKFGSALFSRIVSENHDRLRSLAGERPDLARWAKRAVAEHVAQAGRPDSEGPWFLGI